MARPSKPYTVIKSEKKSHRTKAELEQRKRGEESLLTGIKIKENPEVRKNKEAHKEYRRVKKLLEAIEKEDELYGAVINRYCLITAEIKGLQEDREYYSDMLREMREDLHDQKEQLQNPGTTSNFWQILDDQWQQSRKVLEQSMESFLRKGKCSWTLKKNL